MGREAAQDSRRRYGTDYFLVGAGVWGALCASPARAGELASGLARVGGIGRIVSVTDWQASDAGHLANERMRLLNLR
jgi:hypothetical protein